MSKRLIMFCAIALVLGLAVTAQAAVQNVKVSGDLKVSAIARDDFDLTGAKDELEDQNVIMSQVRVRVDADLTENVATTVRLLNERDWNAENDSNVTEDDTDISIDLAYITMKEMFDSPLTLTLGRQELMIGSGFVMGDPDTNRTSQVNIAAGAGTIANRDKSLRKAFDAVRADLDYDPLMVTLFYSKIDENIKQNAYREKDDIDLYGVDATYALGDDWGTMLEAYYLYDRDETKQIVATPNQKTETVHCPGLRAVTSPWEDLVLTGEIAWQWGTYIAQVSTPSLARSREAMAAQVTATMALPFEKIKEYSPVVGAMYSYYSGDKNAADDTTGAEEYKAWDPLYENQGKGIANVLFNATNTHVINLNASCVPVEDLKLRVDYTDIWLDKELNDGRWGNSGATLFTMYGTNGITSTPAMAERHLGREVDLTLTYDYTEDVQFGLEAGIFFPGNAFDQMDIELKNATEVIGSCSVSF